CGKAVSLALLQAFIADQRRAKLLVASKLGVAADIPALEWAGSFPAIRDAYAANPFADVFRPHGDRVETAKQTKAKSTNSTIPKHNRDFSLSLNRTTNCRRTCVYKTLDRVRRSGVFGSWVAQAKLPRFPTA
ncbi:hypothetical protein, partial [Thalassoroseus pseudoceratinae]|uniref:hypothetical protein n=1 Tax=Thalassoroseus pseudoceratinae TaxID=2713176 RepID=UPI00197CDFFC